MRCSLKPTPKMKKIAVCALIIGLAIVAMSAWIYSKREGTDARRKETPKEFDGIMVVLVARPGRAASVADFVKYAASRASHPERIFFAIGVMGESSEMDSSRLCSLAGTKRRKYLDCNVNVKKVPTGVGVCGTISSVERSLYSGEKYIAHVEPWVGLCKDWDSIAIEQLCKAQVSATIQSEKSVLTHQPLPGGGSLCSCFTGWNGRVPTFGMLPAHGNFRHVSIQPLPNLSYSREFSLSFANVTTGKHDDPSYRAMSDAEWEWAVACDMAQSKISFWAPTTRIASVRSLQISPDDVALGRRKNGATAIVTAGMLAYSGIDPTRLTATHKAYLGLIGRSRIDYLSPEIKCKFGSWDHFVRSMDFVRSGGN